MRDEVFGAGEVPRPRPDRLAPDAPGYAAILRANAAACAAGEAGYLDPVSGLFVFSTLELARRGRCCDTGCRHCPYPDVAAGAAMPEPDERRDRVPAPD